jgi:hypothetical protein
MNSKQKDFLQERYKPKDWYNELYRIFSCVDALLTQTQTVQIGQCLKALAAGENITYKLEDLYHSFRGNKKICEPLENFMHQYIDNIKDDTVEQSHPRIEQEVKNYGSLQYQDTDISSENHRFY